jgi:hypothetical protein
MPSPSILQDLVHQNPIFSKAAARLKHDQFEVAVPCILLG